MITAQQIPQVFQQARAAQAKGGFKRARSLYAMILAVRPNLAEVHFNLGEIAMAEDDRASARSAYAKAAASKPAERAIWLAWITAARGDSKALSAVLKTLASAPMPSKLRVELQTQANAASNPFQSVVEAMGRNNLEAARAALDATGLDTAPAQYWRGRIALAAKDDAAVAHFEAARAGGLDTVELWRDLALALARAQRDEEAAKTFDIAIQRDPKSAELLSLKARHMQNCGDFVEARAVLRRALKLEPENGSLYLQYVSSGKVSADDPILDQLTKAYARCQDRHMAFALSKVCPPDQMFGYLHAGNRATRAAFGYRFEADQSAAAAVRTAYRPEIVSQWAAMADPEPRPIFVTGLPRSGTTLVEQIIAAHPHVASGGELGLLGRYLQRLDPPPDPQALRQGYWDVLTKRFPNAVAITDKSISSYVHVGFIKTLFPNARIIIVRRDPGDTALSLYRNMFVDGQHRYATDLRDIARFMRLFEQQVDFWAETTPEAFTQITYEALVSDPETQSKRLIADAGLEWNEACLDFHARAARVDTLSNAQVRQPMYKSSVGAWKSYAEDLQPFFETYDSD